MKSNQVVNDLKESLLCAIDAVLGSLDNDTIALDATAREADGDAAKVVANLTQNLATSRHEVTVVLRVDIDLVFNDLVLQKVNHVKSYHRKENSKGMDARNRLPGWR